MKGVLFLSMNGIYKSKPGWTSGRGFPNETLLSSPLGGWGGGGLPFFLSRGAAGPLLHQFFLLLDVLRVTENEAVSKGLVIVSIQNDPNRKRECPHPNTIS